MRLEEFRDVLDEALGSTPLPSDAVRSAIRTRVRRRRALRWVAAATAIAVVIGAAVSIVAWPRRGGHPAVSVNQQNDATTVPTPAIPTGPGWRRVPNPPFTGAVAAVRTGEGVVVAVH